MGLVAQRFPDFQIICATVGFVKHICEFEKPIKNITRVTLQLKTKYVTSKTVYY